MKLATSTSWRSKFWQCSHQITQTNTTDSKTPIYRCSRCRAAASVTLVTKIAGGDALNVIEAFERLIRWQAVHDGRVKLKAA